MVDCSTQEVVLCEGVCASSLGECALQTFPETCEDKCRATVLPFYDLANITNRRLVAPFQPSHSAPLGLLYVGYIEEQSTGGGFRRHVSPRASATPFTPPMGNWGVAYYEDGQFVALSAYHSDLADKDHFTKLCACSRQPVKQSSHASAAHSDDCEGLRLFCRRAAASKRRLSRPPYLAISSRPDLSRQAVGLLL